VSELALDDECGRREAVFVSDVPYLTLFFDAGEVLEEVEVEVCTAKFAVGDGAEAVVDLLVRYVGDPFVLDFAQLLGRDFAVGSVGAGIEDGFGA